MIDGKADVRSLLGRSPDIAEALMLSSLGDSGALKIDYDFQQRASSTLSAATAARQRQGAFEARSNSYNALYATAEQMVQHEDGPRPGAFLPRNMRRGWDKF